jgi:hypothetical protein
MMTFLTAPILPGQSPYRVLLPFKRSKHYLSSMRLADPPDALINVPNKGVIVASD